jgi:hypothetical protein
MTLPTGRTRQAFYYGLPMLFCLLVHWYAMKMWFFSDDFAWLGLRFEIHSFADLIGVLFRPQAEGTVRTLSERLFFLVFSSVFGLQSPPFRVWVFLTQFANIVLLMQVARRLTGSALAGFLAAILWCANAGIAMAIGWSAAYNQIACAFFILLAFHLFLRHIDTGERKYWIWQWVVFLLGFLALELNVVYPAFAAGYALCCARPFFRKTLYLFVPSALFVAIHLFVIPAPTDPYYQSVLGSSLFVMFWHYWSFALGALRGETEDWRPLWLGLSVVIAITGALLFFTIRMLRRKQWLPLFLLGWFAVAILPILPLKNHFTEYYVTTPAIGLVILGAWAITQSSSRVTKVAALLLTFLYLTVSIQDARVAENFFFQRSRKMKYLITGLEALPRFVTEKTILLSNVDNDFFWSGFADDPFRLIGITHLYLAPGSEQAIDPHQEWGGISRFVITVDDAVALLQRREATVFSLEGRHLRDVTAPYLATAATIVASHHPDYVNVTDSLYDSRLGPTWYPSEAGFRWMPGTATVKIAGPKSSDQKLQVTGYTPALVLEKGPLQVSFLGDGIPIGSATLKKAESFALEFPLPSALVGRPEMELQIEVSRTTQSPGDIRILGLVFNTFRIK